MEGAIGPLEQPIAAGEEGALRAWLGERVWPLGRLVNGEELVQAVSGRPLSAEPFLTYLRAKVEALTTP